LQAISVINIGPKETRKRLVMGVVMLVVAIGTAVPLILAGADRWWRLGLFLPFWLSALGLFQVKEKT
jgi:hypothetical protein